jgi:hypothetical protein
MLNRMKILALIGLLLFSTASALGQKPKETIIEIPATDPEGFTTEYDRYNNQTVVKSKISLIRKLSGPSKVNAVGFIGGFSYFGKKSENLLVYSLSFSAISPGGCFANEKRIVIYAGYQRISRKAYWDGGPGSEDINALFLSKDIKQIVRAKRVEFQIGTFRGRFTKKDRETIRALFELGSINSKWKLTI